jgi:hypothetical protein
MSESDFADTSVRVEVRKRREQLVVLCITAVVEAKNSGGSTVVFQ